MAALKLGTGLVEIAAVATLIGVGVAEKLALGDKAAAGIPWASMSVFGIMHVVKVCLSACLPDWVREALVLHNDEVDAAVGVCTVVENRRYTRRADLGDPCAIKMPYTDHHREPKGILSRGVPDITVFYSLDRTTRFILNSVSKPRSGSTLLIHEYVPDTQSASSRFRDCINGKIPRSMDKIVLFASVAKALEVAVLWGLGADMLWWATALGWAVAFQGAIALQILDVSRDHLSRSRSDLLAGTLPSHAVEGGDFTLILGTPDNVRRLTPWRTVWALTTIANLASLVAVFFCLRRQPQEVIYAWVLFQATWLLARSVVYRILEGASACQGVVRTTPWDEASLSSRHRAMQLLLGLSRQQITLHPRGIRAYLHDALFESHIVSLLESAHWTLTDRITLPPSPLKPKGIKEHATVLGVIGDPVLRSMVWAHAAALSNQETYDCALVFLKISEKVYAVPSVRVYSCNCVLDGGKGNRHPDSCTLIEWVIFIPHQTGWWCLHNTQTTGDLPAERLDDAELHERLEQATIWNISLRSTKEVMSILETSRAAAKLLLDMARSM